LGSHDLRNHSTHRVEKIINHPQYDPLSMDWDVSLVKLEKPVVLNSCIGLVCLPDEVTAQAIKSEECIIAGWGTFFEGGVTPNKLQMGQVEISRRRECNKSYHGAVT